MKQFRKSFLPETIDHNGITYKMNIPMSSAMDLNDISPSVIAATLKKEGQKCVLVSVLSAKLKGRADLHGNSYKPTKWIFTN